MLRVADYHCFIKSRFRHVFEKRVFRVDSVFLPYLIVNLANILRVLLLLA